MLRYEIDPSDLDDKNRYLIGVNQEILETLRGHVEQHYKDLEAGGRSATLDGKVLQQRFHVLVAMALQYGLDAGDIADQLGVTVSTVHRWAKGTFVPPQVFVRAAAMRGIHSLLQRELDGLRTLGKEPDVPERYTPHIRGVFSESDQDSVPSVVDFDSSKSAG
jgi:hypothetical protein